MKARTKKLTKRGRWVYVDERTHDEIESDRETAVAALLSMNCLNGGQYPFAAIDQYRDYYPGENLVPEEGAWILVKKSPNTEYTVTPMSLWFAEPWPMESKGRIPTPQPHRVKIVTPRGDLGMFPREYSIVRDMSRYYEFFGKGMELKFFSADLGGIPELQLFYLRSRGVTKADAIAMLIGNIRMPGVCWVETNRELASAFVRDGEWPEDARLATNRSLS